MKLRYSVQASEDLIGIWRHVSDDSPDAADRLLEKIESRCEGLLQFPMKGAARDDIRTGVRMLVEGQYLVLYRAAPDQVEVIRVVHGRRDLNDLLD